MSIMDEKSREEDRKAFVRLANGRVNRALKYIRLIGNLSNTSNYYYTEEDVAKIFKVIEDEVTDCRQKFDKKKKEKTNFSLE